MKVPLTLPALALTLAGATGACQATRLAQPVPLKARAVVAAPFRNDAIAVNGLERISGRNFSGIETGAVRGLQNGLAFGDRVTGTEKPTTPAHASQTYAMLLAALGLMGTIMRRRRAGQA